MRSAVWTLSFLGSAVFPPTDTAAQDSAKIQLTAYTVWGVDSKPDDAKQSKLPAELKKLEAQLKKVAAKKFLAVEGKPNQGTLALDKPHKFELPDGTRVEWRLDVEDKKQVVRQILTPPQENARPSEVVLKRIEAGEAARINVIARGEKTLLLVVQFAVEKK